MTNLTLPADRELSGPGPTPGNQGPQGWLQSDKNSHDAMWKLGIKSPSALAVLHFMISKLARGASGVIISAPAMARQMGISERSAKAAVALLRDMKFVQILKSGNTNAYIINSRVAWQGKRGFRYASFNAEILIDENEQIVSVDDLLKESQELIDVPLMAAEHSIRDTFENENSGGAIVPVQEADALQGRLPLAE